MNAVSKKSICPYCHFESGSEDPMKTFYTDGCELFIRKDNSLEVVLIDYYNGRKIYPDSLLYDEVANEYFFPYRKNGVWGDDFLGDFYPLKASQLILQKKHASMDDMKLLMKLPNESDAIFNTEGFINGK